MAAPLLKVGDIVRVIGVANGSPRIAYFTQVGRIGVITAVDTEELSMPYLVEAEGIEYWYQEDQVSHIVITAE